MCQHWGWVRERVRVFLRANECGKMREKKQHQMSRIDANWPPIPPFAVPISKARMENENENEHEREHENGKLFRPAIQSGVKL